MSEYNHRNDTQSLTATDISAIYSLADRLQLAAFWGRLKRVHTSSIDGFVVLHPETDLPMLKIGRRLAGGYVAQEVGLPEWIGIVRWLPILYLVIFVRVIIYLPFVAIDNRQTLPRCWEITRGSTWRFFWMMFIIIVIAFLLQTFVAIPLIEFYLGLPLREMFSRVRMFVGIMSIDFIGNFINFVFAGWAVAIVSHAFNFFREEKGFDILEEKG